MAVDGHRLPHRIAPPLRLAFCALALLMAAGPVLADSILIDGVTHNDVYIRTTSNMYYVEFPDEGVVRSLPREQVPLESVSVSNDEAERRAIHARWNQARLAKAKPVAAPDTRAAELKTVKEIDAALGGGTTRARATALPTTQNSRAQGTRNQAGPQSTNQPPSEIVTDGIVDLISLRQIPLGDALNVTLRPLNLSYVVKDGYIFISTPEKLRSEAHEPLETRYYELGPSSETLFKIVVGNPGGFR